MAYPNEIAELEPPAGASADWSVPQHWDELTAEDHWVWDTLFARQKMLLHDRSIHAFEEGLSILDMRTPGIPNVEELNARLQPLTGWTVVPVAALPPAATFFRYLSERRFPVGCFIRSPKQLDYLEEPDVFHDVFGHVPLLAQPAFADFMQKLGALGLQAIEAGALHRIARLYWYTVEFGLAREEGETRVYGAGILSSFGETHYALESAKPHRLAFDLKRVLRTRYRTDAYQLTYFVIDSLDDLLALVDRTDWPELFRELDSLPDIDPSVAEPQERLAA